MNKNKKKYSLLSFYSSVCNKRQGKCWIQELLLLTTILSSLSCSVTLLTRIASSVCNKRQGKCWRIGIWSTIVSTANVDWGMSRILRIMTNISGIWIMEVAAMWITKSQMEDLILWGDAILILQQMRRNKKTKGTCLALPFITNWRIKRQKRIGVGNLGVIWAWQNIFQRNKKTKPLPYLAFYYKLKNKKT